MDNIINALSNSGKEFWAIFYLLLMSSVAGYVFTYISKQNKTINELKDNYDDALDLVMSLTRYNLKNFNNDCQKQGFVDEGERDEFIEIYDKYRKLNGNGIAKSIKSDFISLYEQTGKFDYGQLMEISQKGKTEIIGEVIKIMEVRCKEIKEYIDNKIMT